MEKIGTSPGTNNSAALKIAANDFVYTQLRHEVARLHALKDSRLLEYIEAAARFACFSHPGRLTDGALENVLVEIGRSLGEAPVTGNGSHGAATSHTLHVVSECLVTGGHTRVLAKWVQRDVSSSHSIVVTRPTCEIPSFLSDIAAERGAPIIMLDVKESIIERARKLKSLSAGADRIILHHHPYDAVPVLAYAAPGGPPVAMFNHAHFWFSLGSGVADVIINTMPYFGRLTERYRHPRSVDLLRGPYGLDRLKQTSVVKAAAKQAMGLAADCPVALTMGNESYFAPDGNTDFFATLTKILEAVPELKVIVVGVQGASTLIPDSIRNSGRVSFPGKVSNPVPYYEAADIFLESFPMPSLGALTEAVAYGQAFPVPAYAENESPRRVNQERISEIAQRHTTEAEYIRYICDLVANLNSAFSKAGELRRRLISDDTEFGDQFPSLYERIARYDHAPRDLPILPSSNDPDHLDLASQTSLSNVSRGITQLLPIRSLLQAHAHASAAGYQSKKMAVLRVLQRLTPPMLRRFVTAFR